MIPQENTNVEVKNESQKRYGFTLILTILLWLYVLGVILKVDPENVSDLIIPGGYIPITIPLWGAIFLTLAIFLANTKRALVWSIGILFFVYLRINGLGSIINALLMIGMGAAWEFYSSKK